MVVCGQDVVNKIKNLNLWRTKFLFLSGKGPRYADVFAVTEGISLSDYDAFFNRGNQS